MAGTITRISGPLIEASGMTGVRMQEVVHVGSQRLVGEIIKIRGDTASIQVYEDTSGIKAGEQVTATGRPLSVELGPGLLGSVYDGTQRPLEILRAETGDFIVRGVQADALSRKKKWDFKPIMKKGDKLTGGGIIGIVMETPLMEHRIIAPPETNGTIREMREGKHPVDETICVLEDKTELSMMHAWPVKTPRPTGRRLDIESPLLSGQRVLDTLFPLAKGGTAAIPGPFGAGKTVTQQALAKWCDAQVIVYVGCGERGNEMAEVLKEFPELEDPKNGRPLMERTILIANTSNMPVAAREASVYTGITIAEYYRDMGYDTALMADSTSRWAEAMREISGRLEEMPGEEGYPAYLGSRLASFYERAGRIECLGNRNTGSTTVIGAVSPPGGDFSEPVTQNTLRVTRVFWGLDARLADRRHFPSINWLTSYSLYSDTLTPWHQKNTGPDFPALRDEAMSLLQRESELMEIVQLVGPDALPESERLILESAKMIREDFLQQNAFHPVDTYCSLSKQYLMLSAIMAFYREGSAALSRGMEVRDIMKHPAVEEIAKMKYVHETDFKKAYEKLKGKIRFEAEKT
ncbi:MAG: V-type ATP synthase subunit A [Candidatus Altiarchaeota archaeon]|nr:V-type ATP synthase subunit A [Candidatus Altiarchaeota archaeon]